MADLASTDVTYTKQTDGFSSDMRYQAVFKLVFGDASLTYPSGGVPILKAKLGCPALIEELMFVDQDNGSGLIYKWDVTNSKIRIYRSPAITATGTVAAPVFTGGALATHTHDELYIGGITATEAVAIQGGDTLGKNAATNRTIVGANSATKGGIVAVTAGTPAGTNSAPAFTGSAVAASNLIELVAATTAVASATTLYVRIRGF